MFIKLEFKSSLLGVRNAVLDSNVCCRQSRSGSRDPAWMTLICIYGFPDNVEPSTDMWIPVLPTRSWHQPVAPFVIILLDKWLTSLVPKY